MFPANGYEVSKSEFKKLMKKPIAVYFGDNIPRGSEIVANYGLDNWRTRLNLALKWQEVAKKYGGDVSVVNAILECPYSATQKCHSIFKK